MKRQIPSRANKQEELNRPSYRLLGYVKHVSYDLGQVGHLPLRIPFKRLIEEWQAHF
jgi:hypothetical protein